MSTPHPPDRYTSYHHPEKTFSILDKARKHVKDGVCTRFEYNGMLYDLGQPSKDSTGCNGTITVEEIGQTYQYVMPWGGAGDPTNPQPPSILTKFNEADFETFISTYEIEGKTIKWILEHQREWKYLCPSEHLEKYEWEHFFFTYKGKKYMFYSFFGPIARNEISAKWPDGYYVNIPDTVDTMVGPFENYEEILRKVYIDNKQLKILFDTEYDDGPILKANYEDWF